MVASHPVSSQGQEENEALGISDSWIEILSEEIPVRLGNVSKKVETFEKISLQPSWEKIPQQGGKPKRLAKKMEPLLDPFEHLSLSSQEKNYLGFLYRDVGGIFEQSPWEYRVFFIKLYAALEKRLGDGSYIQSFSLL